MPMKFDASKGIGNPNTTPIPDLFLDWIAPFLSGSEVKVMLYIFRRTFGFKKDQDAIAYSQFLRGIVKNDGKRLDCGAGVSEGSLIKALDNLTTLGLIFRHRQYAADGGRDTTLYEVNRDGQPHFVPHTPTSKNGVAPYLKNYGSPTTENEVASSPKKYGSPTSKRDDTPTSKNRVTTNSIKQETVEQNTATKANNLCVPTNDDSQANEADKAFTHNSIAKKNSTQGDENNQTIIEAIRALGISRKRANELLETARNNNRDEEYLAACLEKARTKNNPAAYFVTLIRDDADVTKSILSFRGSHTFASSEVCSLLAADENSNLVESEETEEAEVEIDEELNRSLRFSLRDLLQDRHATAWATSFESGKVSVRLVANVTPDPEQWLVFLQRLYPQAQKIEIL